MHKVLILFFVLSLVFFNSCKKEAKWKLPTEVKFKMDISRNPSVAGNLNFTGGNIMIENFSFDGEREEGDDVYFNNNYPGGLNINFDPNNPVPAWDFDIPQGTYTRIRILFNTYGEAGDDQIVLTGTYYNATDSVTYPLRLEFEADEFFDVVALSSGSNIIVLDKDIPKTATIKLDPSYWFQPVTTKEMDNAGLILFNGVETILINDSTNSAIFDLVSDRIEEPTTINFY